jgi:hypothetical protein
MADLITNRTTNGASAGVSITDNFDLIAKGSFGLCELQRSDTESGEYVSTGYVFTHPSTVTIINTGVSWFRTFTSGATASTNQTLTIQQ